MLPRIGRLAVQARLPLTFVGVAKLLALGWHEAAEDWPHATVGRIAFAAEPNPATHDLIVDNDQLSPFRNFVVVGGFAEAAVLREFKKRSAHSDAVLGQVGRHR